VVDMGLITVVDMDLILIKVQILTPDLLVRMVGRIEVLEIILKILSLKIPEAEEREVLQVLQNKNKIKISFY